MFATYMHNLYCYYLDPLGTDSERQSSSRYGGGLRYSNYGYDPVKTRLVASPLNSSIYLPSATIDNLPVQNRRQHCISTTNLSVNDISSCYQEQQQNDYRNSLNHSTPYLSHIRDDGSSTVKSSCQQQPADRYLLNSNQQYQTTHNSEMIERKVTDVVQKIKTTIRN